jgi:hypothetical protein
MGSGCYIVRIRGVQSREHATSHNRKVLSAGVVDKRFQQACRARLTHGKSGRYQRLVLFFLACCRFCQKVGCNLQTICPVQRQYSIMI